MIVEKSTIINKLGLHARAASKLVQTAQQFSADVKVVSNHGEANAKSIMSMMQLQAVQGTEIEIQADGGDEAEALAAIRKLIDDRFDEGE